MNPIVEPISWEVYHAFLTASHGPLATLFHHPCWLQSVAAGLPVQVVLLGLFDADSMVGVLPGFMAKRGPFGAFGSPLRGTMTPYLGWLLRPGQVYATEAVLEATYRHCRRSLGCQFVEIGFLIPPSELRTGDVPRGWESEHPETYRLDLRDGEDALWKNLEQRGRNLVRKARKLGVLVEQAPDENTVKEFYAMLRETLQRQHAVSPHPESFFAALYEHLAPAGMLELLTAKHEGRIVAGALFVRNQDEAHLISAASRSESLHLSPNNLLLWEAIARNAKAGVAVLDLGGKGHPGIDKFKESFGPLPYAYTIVWKGLPPVALARRFMVRHWPRMQNILSHTLGVLKPLGVTGSQS